VSKFVDAFNTLNKTLTASSAYDPATKTAAPLNGDSTVRNMQSRLRSMLGTVVKGSGGAYTRLADIGVTFQKDGTLAVDSTKLNKALASNFNDVASLFATTGTASDSLVSYSGATDATKPGSYAMQVSRIATRATLTATAAPGTTTITAGQNDSLLVTLDGVTSSVTIKPGAYASASELALEVQSEINGDSAFSSSGLAVTVGSNGGLMFSSNRYGSASSVTLSGNAAANLVGASLTDTTVKGKDVAGSINGASASGSGQLLTANGSDAAEGLAVIVNGGAIGDRGMINYSRGYASQLGDLVSSFLDSDGALTAHSDGINKAIKALQKQEDAMSQRLSTRETALRAQYTALDTQLSSMSSMSSYLTQQLAAIKANSGS
jgi:flagellar hook-associated protein 2